MFRVPKDADNPTFDDTFKVSLWRHLTSTGAERKEWVRRRNAAARLPGENKRRRAAARLEEAQARARQQRETRVDAERSRAAAPAGQVPPQPAAASPDPLDRSLRTLGRLARVQLWLSTIELAAYALILLVVLAVCGVIGWLLVT